MALYRAFRRLVRRLHCHSGWHEGDCGPDGFRCWYCTFYEPYDPEITAKIVRDLDTSDWNHYR